jgi:hypothetical protein
MRHSLQTDLKLHTFLMFHNEHEIDISVIMETWTASTFTDRITGVLAAQSSPSNHQGIFITASKARS